MNFTRDGIRKTPSIFLLDNKNPLLRRRKVILLQRIIEMVFLFKERPETRCAPTGENQFYNLVGCKSL